MPLTGGFRRTPVLQIGADIYCDNPAHRDGARPALPRTSAPARERGRVRVATEDFARDPVEGELVHATRETIAIRRDDPEVGRVHVHFPRLGYAVTPSPK